MTDGEHRAREVVFDATEKIVRAGQAAIAQAVSVVEHAAAGKTRMLHPPADTSTVRVIMRIEFYEAIEDAIGGGRPIDGVKAELLAEVGPVVGGIEAIDVERIAEMCHQSVVMEADRKWQACDPEPLGTAQN